MSERSDLACQRQGLERCGLDVKCVVCGGPDWPFSLEEEAASSIELPYFDIEGNEGTLGEVMSS